MRPLLIKTLLILVITVIVLETVSPFLFDASYYKWLILDERNTVYQYDELLGWRPKSNLHLTYHDCRDIGLQTNSRGFRGPEWELGTRKRIAVLGDSYVWGYGVSQDNIFTERLSHLQPEYTFFNLGVSGFGPDQELLLYQQYRKEIQPQMVLLFYNGENDLVDMSTNVRYNGYAKPYFRIVDKKLVLQGVPVPHSIRTELPRYRALLEHSWVAKIFALSAIRIFSPAPVQGDPPLNEVFNELERGAQEDGAQFRVFVISWDEKIQKYCNEHSAICRDVSSFPLLQDPHCGGHWDEEGHTQVAGVIRDLLHAHLPGYIPMSNSPVGDEVGE